MADASAAWTDRPGSDLASSSDEDFVSSQSTASAEPDAFSQRRLSTALGKLHLQQVASSHGSGQSATRTSTPGTGVSIQTTANTESSRKTMQLLDLPLDVLKDIIKEVT